MTSDDLKHLHPEDRTLWLAVEAAVWRLALHEKLPLKRVRPMRRRDTLMYDGWCFFRPLNEVQICLRRWVHGKWEKTRDPDDPYKLLCLIAHELAHLSAGHDASHGPKWAREFGRLLAVQESLGTRIDIEARFK